MINPLSTKEVKVTSQWAKRVFLTIWHCILSAEFIKTHSFRLFFGDFVHWDYASA